MFAGSDLKKWRTEQGVSAADLAERISCDVTTLYRYESGKIKPDPDVMYQICEVLGDTSRWITWMRTEYPTSFGRMFPEPLRHEIPGSLLSLYAVVDDISKMRRDVFLDGADGTIDDEVLAETLDEAVKRLMESAQRIKSLLEMEGRK